MSAFQTILCPTDWSPQATAAFDVACTLAQQEHARVVVLHVERPPLTSLGGTAGVPPLPSEYERPRLQEQLHQMHSPETSCPIEERLEYGDPENVILTAAEEVHADLIVLGTHGRSGLRRLLMGSLAEQIVRHAPCPVLTVRTPLLHDSSASGAA